MKPVRKRLTYANVMSSIAVFLVLGGATAFAASNLGKNSVGAKQLKKNAVTATKLSPNAVTGAKIKPGAVTGAKIDEASLGAVPSATNAGYATNAGHAASADTAGIAASLSGYSHKSVRLGATPVAGYEDGVKNAPETLMFSSGPISVVAKCFTYSTTVYGMFQIKSSVEGAIFDSANDYTYGTYFLNPTTPAGDRELFYESTGGNYAYFEADESEFGAIAPDGTTIHGELEVGVKQGTLVGTQGIYGPGNVCLMAGHMFTL